MPEKSLKARILKGLMPVGILAAGVAAGAVVYTSKPPVEETPPEIKPRAVKTMAVEKSSVSMTIASQGTVAARQVVSLVPQVSGVVSWVSDQFVNGGVFSQGETILEIDPRDYELAVISAEADVADATQQLETAKAQSELAASDWNLLDRGTPSALALRKSHPGVSLRWAGSQEGESEFLSSLMRNTLFAMFGIFFLLAVAFRSYSQPLIIMTAIPFGYMGAVVGHLLLGIDLSMYSILGIVAAAGVVINDNLVLMDYINKLRDQGHNALRAVEIAAEERFRPIFLTSFTTFVGLLPLMAETSVQAQFLIPTVVSLAFGVLFATAVTLLLVPILYLLLNDFQAWTSRVFKRESHQGTTGEDVLA